MLDKFNKQFLDVQITRGALQKFVDENFDKEGTELKRYGFLSLSKSRFLFAVAN